MKLVFFLLLVKLFISRGENGTRHTRNSILASPMLDQVDKSLFKVQETGLKWTDLYFAIDVPLLELWLSLTERDWLICNMIILVICAYNLTSNQAIMLWMGNWLKLVCFYTLYNYKDFTILLLNALISLKIPWGGGLDECINELK